VVNTLVFVVVAINIKMVIRWSCPASSLHKRWWIKVLSLIFILALGAAVDPHHPSVRFMLTPEWGVINTLIFS